MSIESLNAFMDEVLESRQRPSLHFLEEGIHGKTHILGEDKKMKAARKAAQEQGFANDHGFADAPIEIGMNDGHAVACHMLSQIKNLAMFETQDDNLRGTMLSYVGYEPEKVFEIVDTDTGYPAMVAKESNNCCERNCVPSKCRAFRFTLFARESPTMLLPALELDKGCSFSCINKKLRVTAPQDKHTLGYIEPKWHCCHIEFMVYNENRKPLFQIFGKKWQLSSIIGKLPLPGMKRIVFKAIDKHGEPVGTLANEWGGILRELLGDADDYTVKFKSVDMYPEDKLMFLAAAFYLDMKYFTSCCSFSIRDFFIKRYTPAPVVKAMKFAPMAMQGGGTGASMIGKVPGVSKLPGMGKSKA